jgi:hypothetical protein
MLSHIVALKPNALLRSCVYNYLAALAPKASAQGLSEISAPQL